MYNSQFSLKKKLYHDRILRIAFADLKSKLADEEQGSFRIITEPSPKVFYRNGHPIYSPDILLERDVYDIIYEVKSMRDLESCMNSAKFQLNECISEYDNLERDFGFVLVKPRRKNPKKPNDLEFITVYETKGLKYASVIVENIFDEAMNF